MSILDEDIIKQRQQDIEAYMKYEDNLYNIAKQIIHHNDDRYERTRRQFADITISYLYFDNPCTFHFEHFFDTEINVLKTTVDERVKSIKDELSKIVCKYYSNIKHDEGYPLLKVKSFTFNTDDII